MFSDIILIIWSNVLCDSPYRRLRQTEYIYIHIISLSWFYWVSSLFILPCPDKPSRFSQCCIYRPCRIIHSFIRFILGRLIGDQETCKYIADECGGIVNVNIKPIIRQAGLTLKCQAVFIRLPILYIYIGRDKE